MAKKKHSRRIYTLLQWTWGLPQTLAGAGLYIKHRKDPHFNYNGAKVTAWDKDAGVSLGKFIFVPRQSGEKDSEKRAEKRSEKRSEKSAGKKPSVSQFLLDHEYGHTIQSLILGPAYLLLVGAPSLAWNRLPYFARKRKKTGKSYYSAVFERTANALGARHTKHRK